MVVLFLGLIFAFNLYCQEAGDFQDSTRVVNWNNFFEAKGKINIVMTGVNLSAQFVARVVGEDSATISFYGPMGVILGKVFSNNDFFIYYDVFNNWAVVGRPTREKIFKASGIPLSFLDFIRLFKGELLFPRDSLILRNEIQQENRKLFAYFSESFVDFFLVSSNDEILLQYQKKNSEGKIVLNLIYKDYFEIDSAIFPKKYYLQVSERQGYVEIEVENLKFAFEPTKPFSFEIPKSVEVFVFD
ncbi:MAG: DUF4292 domain-containing protein [Ignavibacteria bacterium]|nr:DUF4292 domain-containing protein [Ignavibacteria bacterium]